VVAFSNSPQRRDQTVNIHNSSLCKELKQDTLEISNRSSPWEIKMLRMHQIRGGATGGPYWAVAHPFLPAFPLFCHKFGPLTVNSTQNGPIYTDRPTLHFCHAPPLHQIQF
jgi:hypothetical protein